MVMLKTKDIKMYNGERFQLMAIEKTKNTAQKEANRLRTRRGTRFNVRVSKISKKLKDKRGSYAVWGKRK